MSNDETRDPSPLWCANDEPHDPHSARNEFQGVNYCTGRPALASVPVPTTNERRDCICNRVGEGALVHTRECNDQVKLPVPTDQLITYSEAEFSKMMAERDEWYERLDDLIYSLAGVEEIGEWSNANDPADEFKQLIHRERQARAVSTDHTALIAEADEWVQEENWESSYETDGFNRPGTELIVKLRNALAALESQQGNTTSRSDEYEWAFLNPDGSTAFILNSYNEAQIKAWAHIDRSAKVMRRTPAGPWILAPTDKEDDK